MNNPKIAPSIIDFAKYLGRTYLNFVDRCGNDVYRLTVAPWHQEQGQAPKDSTAPLQWANIAITERGMTSETKDRFTMTSIEQSGEWAGENIGRVLIFNDEGNYDSWKLPSPEIADRIVWKAESMTRDQWIEHLDSVALARLCNPELETP